MKKKKKKHTNVYEGVTEVEDYLTLCKWGGNDDNHAVNDEQHNIHNMHVKKMILLCLPPGAEEARKQ